MKTKIMILSVLAVFALTLSCAGGNNKTTTPEKVEQTEASPLQKADGYTSAGALAEAEGNKSKALENYETSAEILDESGEVIIERGDIHILAAGVAYQMSEFQKSIDHYDAAIKILLRFKGNSKIKAANALNNMGTVYKEIENKSKAQNCWENALQIYKNAPPELQNKTNMAKIEQNLRDLAQGF